MTRKQAPPQAVANKYAGAVQGFNHADDLALAAAP